MIIEQLYTLLQSSQMDKVKEIFQIEYDIAVIQKAINQYKTEKHDVFDTVIRKKKEIKNDAGLITDFKEVHRIALPLQKQIVLLRAAFIGTPEMASNPENDLQKDFLHLMDKIWKDNKMDFRFMETKKRTMSELRCAWLWYNLEDKEYWAQQPINSNLKPRVRVLSYELGDELLPMYDVNDNLIAFARAYKTIDLDEQFNKIKVDHLDIYTKDRFYFKKKKKEIWLDNYSLTDRSLITETIENITSSYKPNLIGKIPIIFFSQSLPEWHDVQKAVERLEELTSNHADTNDNLGNPILFGKGESLNLPEKGEAGRYVEGGQDSDLKFVTWDNMPNSIKMEIENLHAIVLDLTNTPKYKDFENLGQLSGFAIMLRFFMPTLNAKDSEMSVFGEGVQRCYNYLKTLISILDAKYLQTLSFQISPKFASVLPNNNKETVETLIEMVSGGIMSEETAVELNPYVTDKEIEKERLKAAAQAQQGAQGLDNLMNAVA